MCSLCGKILGIASAGTTRLNELVHVLQVRMPACPFWDFAILSGGNGSLVSNGFLLTARCMDLTAEVIE